MVLAAQRLQLLRSYSDFIQKQKTPSDFSNVKGDSVNVIKPLWCFQGHK